MQSRWSSNPWLGFTQKSNLQKHIAHIHEGKKPFQCHLCGYKSPGAMDLKQHHSRVHEGDKEFKCEYCNASFDKPNFLTMHNMKYHEVKN